MIRRQKTNLTKKYISSPTMKLLSAILFILSSSDISVTAGSGIRGAGLETEEENQQHLALGLVVSLESSYCLIISTQHTSLTLSLPGFQCRRMRTIIQIEGKGLAFLAEIVIPEREQLNPKKRVLEKVQLNLEKKVRLPTLLLRVYDAELLY